MTFIFSSLLQLNIPEFQYLNGQTCKNAILNDKRYSAAKEPRFEVEQIYLLVTSSFEQLVGMKLSAIRILKHGGDRNFVQMH